MAAPATHRKIPGFGPRKREDGKIVAVIRCSWDTGSSGPVYHPLSPRRLQMVVVS